jgi:amidase
MTDLAFRSAAAHAADLRAGRIGSRELLEHYLARVERLNGGLNAVVTRDFERARQQADAADAARARGDILGPLHGLPMTIKDALETAGLRTVCGSRSLTEHVPGQDATAVARLRAAGAVVFGKTNVPSFAMDVQTYNRVFGTTNNPWDPSRSPVRPAASAAAAPPDEPPPGF